MKTNGKMTKVESIAKAEHKLVQDGMAKFKGYIGDSVKAILMAARQYVSDITRFPNSAPQLYKDSFPYVTERSWNLLRRIGVGDLVPTAFFIDRDTTINAVSRVKHDLQAVLIGDDGRQAVPQRLWDGKKEVSKLVSEMSATEVQRLLDTQTGKVRTIAEQKAYVPMKSVEPNVSVPAGTPYVVVGKSVIFRKHCEVGVKEFMAIGRALGLEIRG